LCPIFVVLSAVVPEQLADVIDGSRLAALAGPLSYERGVRYFDGGQVGALRVSAGQVAATVHGSDAYAVQLGAEHGRLSYRCSCPVGREGAFCKHCVAVGLSWLGEHGGSMLTLDDARVRLGSLSREELIDLLIDHAQEDDGLARKLLLLTARPAAGEPAEIASLITLVDEAFATHGFVPYREAWGYVRGIDETLDLIEALLEDGRAGDVVVLAEYALAAVERALENVDDSDGGLGGVVARLEALHLEACRRAMPDPLALSGRLFIWELHGDWDVFDQAVLKYADVLGELGVAHYRELAVEQWASVPRLGPDTQGDGFSGQRFRITRIMEALADLSGDLSEQIAVRERDLSSGYRFLEIAELCRGRGDDELALDWVSRGIAAFPDPPDPRLRAFLITEYRRRGLTAEALEQSLAAFTERATLESYRELATDARAANQWAQQRERALELLRSATPAITRRRVLRDRGWSELVRVLLWEGDTAAAWDAAGEGGCTRSLWMELAEVRRADHPEDTLVVYRQHVEDVIAAKNNRAYDEAVQLIDGTIRELFNECGRPNAFGSYVEEIRTTHKPKRNLIKLMVKLKTQDPRPRIT
jgi:hypothetical protein